MIDDTNAVTQNLDDREILGEDAILECKTTNSFVNTKKFRTGEFPEQWWAQVCHYMAVTGAKKAYLAVLSECRDFRIFELDRDEAEIDALMAAEKEFWDKYVVTKRTPPADGHSATSETIKKLFPEDVGDAADLFGYIDVFERRKAINDHIKGLKAELVEKDNQIKIQLGSHSTGTCGRFSVSWKLQNTAGLDREAIKADYPGIDFAKYATQSRVFRVTEKKQKSA